MIDNVNHDFLLIETKGDVKFWQDSCQRMIQQIHNGEFLLVKDGDMEYKDIYKVGNYTIKYNLNGLYGYCIAKDNIILEDRYWNYKTVLKHVNSVAKDWCSRCEEDFLVEELTTYLTDNETGLFEFLCKKCLNKVEHADWDYEIYKCDVCDNEFDKSELFLDTNVSTLENFYICHKCKRGYDERM
jgi:hypothetical protein